MPMSYKDDLKVQKKLAKAEVKAAKKNHSSGDLSVQQDLDVVSESGVDRSTQIAEKELVLHRWKVVFAAVSALVALASLIVLLVRS
jgi:hypothetical protein